MLVALFIIVLHNFEDIYELENGSILIAVIDTVSTRANQGLYAS